MSYLAYMVQRGFPLTRTPTKAFAWAIAIRSRKADSFGKEGPSEHWWGGFRQRHPELTLRKPDKLERSRAEALNPDVVKQYFELLNEVMQLAYLSEPPHDYLLQVISRMAVSFRRAR